MHIPGLLECKIEATQGRQATPLPAQLLDHCTVCFEEKLYQQALSLLSRALTSGKGTSKACYVPPPQHLALAATLVVHPLLTSRTSAQDKHAASDDALRYLQHVVALLSPRQAGLDLALRFNERNVAARGKRVRSGVMERASDLDDAESRRIRLSFAEKDALWSRAEDFWAVVGWAFNCSSMYKHRWERWRLWLCFMLDVLEHDLDDRLQGVEELNDYRTGVKDGPLSESLLAYYMITVGDGRANKRRLMRAILADGTPKSLAEFGEIWKNETKPPKKKQSDPLAKRRKLDLENGEFGDYCDDESQDDSPGTSTTHRSRLATAVSSAKQSRAVSEDEEGSDDVDAGDDNKAFGGVESIQLRQRFLALLIHFCAAEPLFLDVEDLFDLFAEFLRPLPLEVFQQFILPSTAYLDSDAQCSMVQMLLRPLLAATAPAYDANALTQATFEAHYAIYPANTTGAVDNAKVSLLMESLMRLLWNSGQLEYRDRIRKLVIQGIEARKAKVAFDGRRKVGSKARDDEAAMLVMDYSAERMLMVLEMAEMTRA